MSVPGWLAGWLAGKDVHGGRICYVRATVVEPLDWSGLASFKSGKRGEPEIV